MRKFTLEARDSSNNVVFDPEGLLRWAEGLQFSTKLPGGPDQCSFRVRRRDALTHWVVQRGHRLMVYDGVRLVYRGVITDIQADAVDNSLEVIVQGESLLLQQRKLRKVWVDNQVLSKLVEPSANADLTVSHEFHIRKDKGYLSVTFEEDDSSTEHDVAETYQVDYYHPTEDYIYNVTGTVYGRSGEGWNVRVYNVDNGVNEDQWQARSVTKISFTLGATAFSGATCKQFRLRVSPRLDNEIYNNTDYVEFADLKMLTRYESGHSVATPTYTSSQIIEDGLRRMGLLGSVVSSDLSKVASITTVLDPFGFEQFVSGVEFLDGILQISDAAFSLYYFALGYRVDSSNLPMLEVFARSTADYEYVIRAAEAVKFDIYQTDEDLVNYVFVEYESSDLRQLVRSPVTDATLTDAASVAAYGRRDGTLNIGRGTSTTAVQLGRAYLAENKDLKWQGSIEVQGGIRTKAGVVVPACWARAGERAYLPDLGIVIYIGSTKYDEAKDSMTLTADKPPSTLDVILARRKQFFEE